MFRFAIPIILVAVSITGFLMFTSPLYKDFTDLKAQVVSYNQALENSKALEAERNKLTDKLNSISPNNLDRIDKLLPNSVDNIRLILEIEKMASPYGMVLKDVKYNVAKKESEVGSSGIAETKTATVASEEDLKDYASWDLGFSVQGSYYNFLNFVKNLESNLRIVDIVSVTFSSIDTGSKITPTTVQPNNYYKYDFKIKTYWLKN